MEETSDSEHSVNDGITATMSSFSRNPMGEQSAPGMETEADVSAEAETETENESERQFALPVHRLPVHALFAT